ncbi:metallophosphoesterase [Formosa maritima]|nr:metallophosphoesterase [Formosa maritima]
MFRKLNIIFLILFFISFNSYSQVLNENDSIDNRIKADSIKINDGPYVFIKKDVLIEKSIIDGEVITKELPIDAYKTEFHPEEAIFEDVDNIVVLSDIHGQFDLAIEILKNNKVIDSNLNWTLGSGHLVIVGDIFDRGPKVTETLWFVYHLEQQALKSGGKVHFTLGNHEYMILRKDLRYLNSKYRVTSYLLKTNYTDLFNNQTVLGRWLRSKPTVLKINKDTYVHGGLSKAFLDLGYNIDSVNKLMRESIDVPKDQLKETPFYINYYGSSGPIWYRGYFNDNLPESEIKEILKEINSKHIIVGHCSNEEVVQLYNEKIFGVDSSIKNGVYGEVLLINGKKYIRGTMEGKEESFKKETVSSD